MFKNPVIRGFAPDPSALRVGDDFYIANSTFEWFPGVRLYHSKDLQNWTELAPPLTRKSQLDMSGDPNSGGVWAPDISYRDGLFYLVYTDVKSKTVCWYNAHNYVVWASSIEGPWSDPVYLNSSGFDPSLFHDDDGRTWLVNMREGFLGILVQEFDTSAKKLTGPVLNVYPGSGAGYTEGPHLYRRGEYYYLLTAEGGTGFGHQITVARSKCLAGPYETMPANPLLTSKDDATLSLQKAGHGDLFQDAKGDWYVCYLCSRPVAGHLRCVLGRETAIEKIVWTDEGWPRLAQGGHHPLPAQAIEEVPYRDSFSSASPDYGWKSLRIPLAEDISLTDRKGFLRLNGRESIFSCNHVALLGRKQESLAAFVTTGLDFDPHCPEHAAGLVYMYDNAHFYMILKSAAEDGGALLTVYDYQAVKLLKLHEETIPGGSLTLGLRTDSLNARFYAQIGDSPMCEFGPKFDASVLSDEVARGFTGAHFALYCHDRTGGKHPAFFSGFSIEPESPCRNIRW
jgi:xylan 1,4-beta-xylosidase